MTIEVSENEQRQILEGLEALSRRVVDLERFLTSGIAPAPVEARDTEEPFSSWVTRHLAQLNQVTAGFEKRIAAATEAVGQLRDSTAIEDWARSVRLLERITALENGSRLVGTGSRLGRIRLLENQVRDLVAAMSATGVRFRGPFFTPQFEDKIPQAGEPWANEEAARPISTETIRKAEREFATDAGGPDVIKLSGFVDKETADFFPVDRSHGEHEIRYTALHDAAARVQRYMNGHFSTATINGVMAALWGPEFPQEPDVPEGRIYGQRPE